MWKALPWTSACGTAVDCDTLTWSPVGDRRQLGQPGTHHAGDSAEGDFIPAIPKAVYSQQPFNTDTSTHINQNVPGIDAPTPAPAAA